MTTVSVNTVTFSQIDNLILPTQAVSRLSFCAEIDFSVFRKDFSTSIRSCFLGAIRLMGEPA